MTGPIGTATRETGQQENVIMIQTTVIGAAGRMGRRLVAHILDQDDFTLSGAVECGGCPAIGLDAGTLAGTRTANVSLTDTLTDVLDETVAVVDFSTPDATMAAAPLAARHGCALVIGTTGLSQSERHELATLAEDGARIVLAPNMSVGVNLLFALSAQLAQTLGPDYDIEVVEMHHHRKVDAPSGTALRLAEILAAARQLDPDTALRHGRVGAVGARPQDEIGMHAVRGGSVVGDHTVLFAADGERIELTHRAESRDTFVHGALRAIRFAVSAGPGLYDMQDVLRLGRD